MICKHCGADVDPREEEKIYNMTHKHVTYSMRGIEQYELCIKCNEKLDKALTDRSYINKMLA